MKKETIETKEGTVVNFTRKDGKIGDGFCWMIRNKDIKDGKAIPINSGDLEWYMNKIRRVVMKKRRLNK